MKTTLELPDALVKQVKLRALHTGVKLKDAVADLLRKGLAVAEDLGRDEEKAVVIKDKETGLPVIQCRQAPAADERLTPDRVADILLAQEVDWNDAAGR